MTTQIPKKHKSNIMYQLASIHDGLVEPIFWISKWELTDLLRRLAELRNITVKDLKAA